tara:strand:+ start:598 stop:951 length:354 start_codon:yes stop_codon:yes gene_type:complete
MNKKEFVAKVTEAREAAENIEYVADNITYDIVGDMDISNAHTQLDDMPNYFGYVNKSTVSKIINQLQKDINKHLEDIGSKVANIEEEVDGMGYDASTVKELSDDYDITEFLDNLEEV